MLVLEKSIIYSTKSPKACGPTTPVLFVTLGTGLKFPIVYFIENSINGQLKKHSVKMIRTSLINYEPDLKKLN